MASLIILVYDESRKLIEKPDDYDNLLEVARAKFSELEHASNDEIAFHFIPKWFDHDVELDSTSFADVHARAILRITTAASAPAQRPESDDVEIQDDCVAGPMPPHSGAIPPLGWMKLRVVFIPTKQKLCYHMKPCTVMDWLMEKVAADFDFDLVDYCFFLEEYGIQGGDTPNSLEIKPNELIEVHPA